MFRRVNALLGTNYSMHDLRHSAALRMSRDESLSIRDVQTILGHAHLSTTADVYLIEDEDQVIRRVQQHLIKREHRSWLGEVQGLEVSLEAAKRKLVSLDRSLERNRNNGPIDLAAPV